MLCPSLNFQGKQNNKKFICAGQQQQNSHNSTTELLTTHFNKTFPEFNTHMLELPTNQRQCQIKPENLQLDKVKQDRAEFVELADGMEQA
jgi:hypothetical protein